MSSDSSLRALGLVVVVCTWMTLAPGAAEGQASNGSGPPAPAVLLATPNAGEADHERLAPRALAARVDGGIQLDGRLDEAVWQSTAAATGFWQREPDEGMPATQRTEVRFAYDDETLYIGARMYDSEGGEGVTSRLVRRDAWTQSDQLTVWLDTFLDHNSQSSFTINPAGVRSDAYDWDNSWNPVWRAEAVIDAEGWTTEMAIPFSQLRFPDRADHVWGMQIERTVTRLNEISMWSFWYQDDSGGPSRYGHLDGLGQIQARTDRLTALPYAVSQVDIKGSVDAENPFLEKTSSLYRVGADLKYLLTSNLTLSATVNPDFGQAEVDPAVVNLSAFETFFPEKREFFIEGQQNFGFGNFWCKFCSNASSLGMLFTRRIGRSPQATSLASDAGEYSDAPTSSTILGAAKVTGKTSKGTSIGVLAALTSREHAEVFTATGSNLRQEVEPTATYVVGRVKQDLDDGKLYLGAIATGVFRDFEDPALRSVLTNRALGVGVDAEYWWADRNYHLLFSGALTDVAGSPDAIQRVQRASARYFQRPDRGSGENGIFSRRYDPAETVLRGWGLYSRVAKDAGGWQWELSGNARSPGFENNDIAFLTRTDYVWMNGNIVRNLTTPGRFYRSVWMTLGAQQQYNFDGDLTDRQYHASIYMQAPFYWGFDSFIIHRPSTFDDRLLRGGPVARKAATTFWAGGVSTDNRKPVFLWMGPSYGWSEDGGWEQGLGLDLTIKPISNVNVTLSPNLSRSLNKAQYLKAIDDPTATAFNGQRYIFSELEQTSLSMRARLNWTFTPTMSLELFAQPLISANEFRAFREFVEPRQLEKRTFGVDVGTVRSEGTGDDRTFHVDPDGTGPAAEFTVDNQDFNFRSLRGNAVFRWEFMPGSTLFLVWTQDRNATDPIGNLDFSRDSRAMFDAEADNILLLKLTYWLGL